jgi:hypothetical protein
MYSNSVVEKIYGMALLMLRKSNKTTINKNKAEKETRNSRFFCFNSTASYT